MAAAQLVGGVVTNTIVARQGMYTSTYARAPSVAPPWAATRNLSFQASAFSSGASRSSFARPLSLKQQPVMPKRVHVSKTCRKRSTTSAADAGDAVSQRAEPVLLEPRLGSFYGGFFGLVGVRTTLLPLWLGTVCNLQSQQIGVVLSMMQLCSVPLGPLFGYISDVSRKPRGVMIGLTLAATLASCALILVVQGGTPQFTAIFPMVVLASALFSAALPISESLSQSVLGPGSPRYGRVRLWGSIGFMLTSTFVGQAASHYGNWVILYALGGFMALTSVAAMLLPGLPAVSRPKKPKSTLVSKLSGSTKKTEPASRSVNVMKLIANPIYVLAVVTAALLQASHAMYYGFGTIAFTQAGYSGGTIGLLWSVGVAAEIVLFAGSSAIKSSLHPPSLLLLGGAAGALRWTTMGAFAHFFGGMPLPVLVLTQLLHGFTFGAVHLGAVGFLGMATPLALRSSAQGIYGAVSDGGIMAVITMLSAVLFSKYQTTAFLAMGVVSLIGCIGSLVLWKFWDGKELPVV